MPWRGVPQGRIDLPPLGDHPAGVHRALLVLLLLSACKHVPPVGQDLKEQIRYTEARAYQTWGGFLVGACVATAVAGATGGGLYLQAQAESGLDYTPTVGVVMIASGLVVGAIGCVVGGRMIHTGNQIATGAIEIDAPAPPPPQTPAPSSGGGATPTPSRASCYSQCRTAGNVAECRRGCDREWRGR